MSLFASSSGVHELERRSRLQRQINRLAGSPRSCSRSRSGQVTITLRNCTSASRRTSTALRRASKEQLQRLTTLPGTGQAQRLARERRPGGTDRIKRVVLAPQPALVTGAASDLQHRLAATAQMAGKSGTLVTGAFYRPHASAAAVLLDEPQ